MTEIVFKYDVNTEKFKTFVWKAFTAKQIEDILTTLYMYIEIVGSEEMNQRIYGQDKDELLEIKLKWVATFADTFGKFLKIIWQRK